MREPSLISTEVRPSTRSPTSDAHANREHPTYVLGF